MAPQDSSKVEKPTKRFNCTFKDCNASFTKNSKLVFHIRKHTGERPFACDEEGCTKTYTNSSHLRRHKVVSHGEKKSQEVVCEFDGCGQVLANKYSLKKHCNRIHNREKFAYSCNVCNEQFSKKRQLQRHTIIHTGPPEIKCTKCGAKFKERKHLSTHIKRHRTFTCECGLIFYRWWLLVEHKQTCRQAKYICKECSATFSSLWNYRCHKTVHLDQKDKHVFVCPIEECKRFYFYKKNLLWHMKMRHNSNSPVEKFPCTYPSCKVVLHSRRTYKLHMQRHFKWTVKKTRRARLDKGKIKKDMATLITGIEEKDSGINDERLVELCGEAVNKLNEIVASL